MEGIFTSPTLKAPYLTPETLLDPLRHNESKEPHDTIQRASVSL